MIIQKKHWGIGFAGGAVRGCRKKHMRPKRDYEDLEGVLFWSWIARGSGFKTFMDIVRPPQLRN